MSIVERSITAISFRGCMNLLKGTPDNACSPGSRQENVRRTRIRPAEWEIHSMNIPSIFETLSQAILLPACISGRRTKRCEARKSTPRILKASLVIRKADGVESTAGNVARLRANDSGGSATHQRRRRRLLMATREAAGSAPGSRSSRSNSTSRSTGVSHSMPEVPPSTSMLPPRRIPSSGA